MTKIIAQIAALAAASAMMAGCSKSAEETTSVTEVPVEAAPDASAAAPAAAPTAAAAPAGAEVLPGASRVRSAMASQDYENAVGGLLALRGAATRSPQTEEFMVLYDEVKFGLMDASTSNPKAAQALAMLRAATASR